MSWFLATPVHTFMIFHASVNRLNNRKFEMLCFVNRYACSRTGHIFEIDIKKVNIQHVRRLLPNETRSDKDKQTFRSGKWAIDN